MRAKNLFYHPHLTRKIRVSGREIDELQVARYIYDCAACGVSNGPWPANQSPDVRECYDCGKPVRRTPYVPLYTCRVQGDIPDHYSKDFDATVRSRRHLKDLQKAQGTKDYEVVRGPVDGWK